jgi:hypothetical protein
MLGFLYHQLTCTPKPPPHLHRPHRSNSPWNGRKCRSQSRTAKQLAERGLSRLILGVRTISKGQAARDEISRRSPGCDVDVWPLDMESFERTKAFGERVKGQERFDIVILSAGIKLLEYTCMFRFVQLLRFILFPFLS